MLEGDTIESRIRGQLPAVREWMIRVIAETAVKKYLARRNVPGKIAAEELGRRVYQTPGPGQT